MTHKEILLDIVKAKIPVMIEKPLCTTTSDCAKVISAAGNDAMVWVGLEYRYMPAVAELIERVNEGIVGTVRMVSIREHRFPFLKKSRKLEPFQCEYRWNYGREVLPFFRPYEPHHRRPASESNGIRRTGCKPSR